VPDPAAQMKGAFEAMGNDPSFIGLSYQDQSAYRAQVAQAYLSKVPEFAALPGDQQQASVQKIVSAYPPALKNKDLEAQISGLVSKARAGDPASLDQVKRLSEENGFAAGGVLTTLAANYSKATGGVNPRAGLASFLSGKAAPPPTKPSDYDLLLGDDSNKLQTYFSSLAQTDQAFAGLSTKVPSISVEGGKLKVGMASVNKGSLVGGALDMIPGMFTGAGLQIGRAHV
jgi:hypothetical protein